MSTQAKWQVDPAHKTTICEGRNTVAEAALTWGLMRAIEHARLLAAAPELLEALTSFLDVFEEEIGSLDCTTGIERAAKTARAAIAKAKGQP